jgi:hypothetical protein
MKDNMMIGWNYLFLNKLNIFNLERGMRIAIS